MSLWRGRSTTIEFEENIWENIMDKMKWATNCSRRREKRLESDCFDERAEKWEVTRIVVGHNNTGRSQVRPIVL